MQTSDLYKQVYDQVHEDLTKTAAITTKPGLDDLRKLREAAKAYGIKTDPKDILSQRPMLAKLKNALTNYADTEDIMRSHIKYQNKKKPSPVSKDTKPEGSSVSSKLMNALGLIGAGGLGAGALKAYQNFDNNDQTSEDSGMTYTPSTGRMLPHAMMNQYYGGMR